MIWWIIRVLLFIVKTGDNDEGESVVLMKIISDKGDDVDRF